MPIYRFKCPNCGETIEEIRNIADRNKVTICPSCGHEMERQLPSSFGFEMVSITGLAKFNGPYSSKPVIYEKHDNWIPPADYLMKKTANTPFDFSDPAQKKLITDPVKFKQLVNGETQNNT